jgi:hypothetical protein
MQLNGVNLVDRHNRAGVLEKVALRVFFVNNGEYFDPYDISGVTVFNKLSNTSPSAVIDTDTALLSSSISSSLILMHFGASANDSGAALYPSSYNPNTNTASTSGIYRVGTGEYVVVLAPDTSGRYNFFGSSLVVENSASSVADYIDIWTVKFFSNSDYQCIVNNFHLYRDTIFAVTQPLLLTASNKLINKHIKLDSKVDLKVSTDVYIENRDIDEATKNVFRDSAIVSAMFKIEKINEDTMALPSRVEVSSFAQTSALVDITSDNTMVFNFNTATLSTHPSVANFAGLTGTYCLTCKYNLLNQTIVSQPMYFIIS